MMQCQKKIIPSNQGALEFWTPTRGVDVSTLCFHLYGLKSDFVQSVLHAKFVHHLHTLEWGKLFGLYRGLPQSNPRLGISTATDS